MPIQKSVPNVVSLEIPTLATKSEDLEHGPFKGVKYSQVAPDGAIIWRFGVLVSLKQKAGLF